MSDKKLISVIIPGRNQGEELGKTIDDIAKHAKTINYDVEVLYIDGNSSDNSVEVAKKRSDHFHRLEVLSDPPDRRGKGGAVQLGMAEASGDYKMFMDADNSTNFREIDKLLPYIDKYELIIGSRYSDKATEPQTNWFKAFFAASKDVLDVIIYGHAKSYTAKVKQGRWRQFVSRGGNLAFTIFLGQSFADSRCGFKLFSKKAADTIFPLVTLPGFGFDTEVFVIAKKYKLPVIEVPVKWNDDAIASNISLKDTLKSFIEIFQIRIKDIRGTYKIKK
ncbi:hypothetical protein COZ22_01310 [bacterium (Candidatus Howlettbacteria) CG_4_10_14_3_um_filter_37_10]|nr:MAG: hypothetical protein COX25_01820 [bacterium (Candidatus Howlettbacteria) CG23_combo_of_CG06-09_8_20_14_all_37_9]PIY00021.1 MAG: hypothetical protein COZ22_01310 [bacterium (Candidatus Howlettbacteria) CG_4_10_14_3_um_filter_37_10]PJB06879.1 MAG: hypothetical protein CO123_01220 [bacterium (Candidatus Howlettbacteria) CG_4_9_14_3_um_filter_37_10]